MTLNYGRFWPFTATDSTVELFTNNSQRNRVFNEVLQGNATRFTEAD